MLRGCVAMPGSQGKRRDFICKSEKECRPGVGIPDACLHTCDYGGENMDWREDVTRNHTDKIYKKWGKMEGQMQAYILERPHLYHGRLSDICAVTTIKMEYDMVKKMDAANYYKIHRCRLCVLGNEDRHGQNFGFYMDNRAESYGPYIRSWTDHAFQKMRDIPSQSEQDETASRQRMRAD